MPLDYKIPSRVFFTKGVGKHKDKIQSELLALRNAGIEDFIYNELDEAGTFPAHCDVIPRDKGLRFLEQGQFINCILIKDQTNEPNRLIAASIGLAIPQKNGLEHKICGYILGHQEHGKTEEQIGDYVEDNAATLLATKLGIKFNSDTDWDEREKLFKASGKIFKTSNYTQSAEGDKNGIYTSIIVAAVYLP